MAIAPYLSNTTYQAYYVKVIIAEFIFPIQLGASHTV